jgi:aspartyl/glutamyl-tRNA(Asn/Gln) amidotransferase C subunit
MITTLEIEKLAKISKLNFTTEQIERLKIDLEEIIEFANQVSSLDNSQFLNNSLSSDVNSLREDIVLESFTCEQITSNVESVNGFFQVKKG